MTAVVVYTVPVAQPRVRHRTLKTKAGALLSMAYTPAAHPVNAYKAALQSEWAKQSHSSPLDGPVRLSCTFVLPRPKSRIRKHNRDKRLEHVCKPDLDNLVKSTKDALNGLAWRDDSQVSQVRACKCWAAASEQPHVEIYVMDLTDWEPDR